MRARGELPAHAGTEPRGEQLLGECGEDHVDHRRLQRPADEPAAQRVCGELAHAVGLHPRLLEQPPVDRELPIGRVRQTRTGRCRARSPSAWCAWRAASRAARRRSTAGSPAARARLRRSRRASRAAPRSRGRRCASGSRCARDPTVRVRSAPTPGTGAEGSPSSGRTDPGRRGRAARAVRRRGAAAARTPPADLRSAGLMR